MLTLPTDLSLLISAAAFLAIFLFCLGILQFTRQRTRRQEIIEKIKSGGEITAVPKEEKTPESDQTSFFKLWFFGLFGKIGNIANPAKLSDSPNVRIRFFRAGIRRENAAAVYWGLKIILSILCPAIFFILRISLFKLMSYQVATAVGVATALFGFYLPNIWLRYKTDKRKEKLLEALPDALDLLVVCVEAGMGLDGAINRVAQEIKLKCSELSEELTFLNLELRAGKPRHDALRNLALRSDLEEMKSLVTLLIQTDKFGTSIAQALRVYSDSYRTQRFQRAEELAAKIPVKLVFPLVLFILPALFVAIVGPAAIRIYQNIFSRF
jgi:tight adherence protein C